MEQGTEQKEKIEQDEERHNRTLLKQVRRDFLYGLFVVLPAVATIVVVVFLINIISGPVSALFGRKIPPILSFFITFIAITLIGIAARNIIGKAVLSFIEDLMNRIPIVNTVYKSMKQIISAFTLQKKGLLSAVLIEYPRKGVWALAFVTKDEVEGLVDINGVDHSGGKCSVFVPTTPNPTSGYYIYVNKKDVIPLSISVEESVKVLMSAGVLSPSALKKKIKKAPE